MVRERTRSDRLAAGYVRAAAQAYKSAESWGICKYLHTLYPTICPPCEVQIKLSDDILVPRSPPKVRQRSMSQSNETQVSMDTTASRAREDTPAEDSLDSLAVIRASLALAQEQDPAILLKTLLRLLCQVSFTGLRAVSECPVCASRFRCYRSHRFPGSKHASLTCRWILQPDRIL